MVRRASPVLSLSLAPAVVAIVVPAVTLAYLELAKSLPASGSGQLRVDAAIGVLAVLGAVAAVAPLTDAWPVAVLLLVGVGIIAIALDQVDARGGASLPEALAWGAGGMLFARAFAPAPIAVAVPILLAALDLAGVIGSAAVLNDVAKAGDVLTLEIPAWGGGQAADLPALEAGIFGALLAWSTRHAFRPGWTTLFMLEGAMLAAVTGLPAILLIVAAYLLPNIGAANAAIAAEHAHG